MKSGGSTTPEGPGDSPSVGFLVTVVQRLQALLLLLLAEACGVRHLEEGGGELHQPARVDGGHLPHVLLGSQHQLMVHHPVENRGRTLDTDPFVCLTTDYGELRCVHTTQAAG